MPSATETPQDLKPKKPMLGGGCGGCTYTFNPDTHCYDLATKGCSGNCRCAQTVCGLGSQFVQKLKPDTVSAATGVSLSCFATASDESWLVLALIDLARQEILKAKPDSPKQPASPNHWKTACIGLGILCVLLAIGLAAAWFYR